MRLFLLLLVVVGLAAGCFGPPSGTTPPTIAWTPDACDGSGATRVNQAAPMVAFFQRPSGEAVRSFVELAGDELEGTEPLESDDYYEAWPTRGGLATYEYDQPEFEPPRRLPERLDVIAYQTDRPWLGTNPGDVESGVRALFSSMGAPDALDLNFTLRHDVRLGMSWTQVHHGGEFAATLGRYDWDSDAGSVTEVSPVYALDRGTPTLDWDQVYAIARSYIDCVRPDVDNDVARRPVPETQPAPVSLTWASINSTFAYAIPFLFPEDCLHAGERIVYVDAITGAVVELRDASTCEQ